MMKLVQWLTTFLKSLKVELYYENRIFILGYIEAFLDFVDFVPIAADF